MRLYRALLFTFPLDPNELFAERAIQMKALGVSASTVAAVRRCGGARQRERLLALGEAVLPPLI